MTVGRSIEKVALVTIFPPDDVLTGTVVEQRKIAGFREAKWLTWIALRGEGVRQRVDRPHQMKIITATPWARPYRFFSSRVGSRLLDAVWSRLAAWRLAGLCGREGVDRVWTVAEPLAPCVATVLARRAGLKLHVTVHDHPLRNHQLYPERPLWYWQSVEQNCIRALKAADSVDVVSRSLERYVRQHTACRVNLYMPRVPAPDSLPEIDEGRPEFRVGFNGNMHTGQKEVEVFLEWLKRIGRKYEFHLFGERAILPELVPALAGLGKVVRHDYEPDPGKYAAALGQVDAFYVGAWFGADKDLTVRYSFPSKIAAILSAGVPLICHGPDYWELASWLREIRFGVFITGMDAQIVPAELQRFVCEAEVRKTYRQGVREMFDKWLRLPSVPAERKLPWEMP